MSSESNFSFTTKVDGDLLTLRGDTFPEFVTHLSEAAGVPAVNNLLNILNGATPQEQQAVATIQQSVPATLVQPGVPPQAIFAPVPPPATAAPVTAGAMSCVHGAMSAKKGNGAKGEWRGWFCPTPKGTADQCKPQFVTKGSNEWVTFPA